LKGHNELVLRPNIKKYPVRNSEVYIAYLSNDDSNSFRARASFLCFEQLSDYLFVTSKLVIVLLSVRDYIIIL
jgi:hypothetical protein